MDLPHLSPTFNTSALFYGHLQRAGYPTFETTRNKQILAGRAMYHVIHALRDAQIMCA